MNPVDKFLNNVTMYRLLVYGLTGLAALSIVFAFMAKLAFSPTSLVLSLLTLIAAAYVTDRAFGRLFHAPTNMESALITALILFLIVQPAHTPGGGFFLALTGAISSASKFLLARDGKHLFNPAALAATVLGVTGLQATTWWIGSTLFWPFSLLVGLAVVRKIRRLALFLSFAAVAVVLQLILFVHSHVAIGADMKQALLASPFIFLSTIMLTEPATMPPRRQQQIVFAALVAVLYITAFKIGPLVMYPEVALLIGNIFAYLVSPKFRVRLELKEVQKISDRVYNYVFQPDRAFAFLPGQYMELTLAGVPYDSRGNRRTFTIASSPTEQEVHLGIKYFEPASMYKSTFMQLRPGDTVYASQLAGNFTLNDNESKPLAFIAGGIGITPFRSMIKYLTDNAIKTDITLVYIVGDPREFVYIRELKAAAAIGVKLIPVVTDPQYQAPGVVTAKVSAELLQRLIPDYDQRTFYVSGSNYTVDTTKNLLQSLGVPGRRIMTDHFSGY